MIRSAKDDIMAFTSTEAGHSACMPSTCACMIFAAAEDNIAARRCLVERAARCTAYSKGISALEGAEAETATEAPDAAPTITSVEKRVDMLLHGPMNEDSLAKATSDTHRSRPVS